MRDLIPEMLRWYDAGERFALATVVATTASAPLPPGTTMAVSAGGTVLGSVSGGCVESAIYELAGEVIRSGEPQQAGYGYSDVEALAASLTCGGRIEVLVRPVDSALCPEFAEVARSITAGEPVATATVLGTSPARLGAQRVVWPDRAAGTLGSSTLDDAVTADVRGMLSAGATGTLHYGPDGERRSDAFAVFVTSHAPPPRMLVFGAIDFAAAVAHMGRFLGYRVTVCDARDVFATPQRLPAAHEVIVDWPHRYLARATVGESTAICVLTHDPKFDVPLLAAALRTEAGFIGVLGSRRTQLDRIDQLRAAGVTDEQLTRLSAPVGLDLGARTPEETAVSIAAEIIARRYGGTGRPLRALDGPIHSDTR
jgi:xanthine dehydrogenase accessory factor